MATMSLAKPRPAAMQPEAFRMLLKSAGLNLVEAAAVLEVNVATVSRWRSGYTPISATAAKLIKLVIKKKK